MSPLAGRAALISGAGGGICRAIALAYVAAGRAEAYRESGSMIWDVAGGCALVKAAGGHYHMSTEEGLDRPLEVAALAAVLAVFSVAVFVYGLRLPLPLWPAL